MSKQEGEWHSFRRSKDQSFDLHVVGITSRQIPLTALRACVREVTGAKRKLLEQRLEKTHQAVAFLCSAKVLFRGCMPVRPLLSCF